MPSIGTGTGTSTVPAATSRAWKAADPWLLLTALVTAGTLAFVGQSALLLY